MTKITFKTEEALVAFHSMVEGMGEVARDECIHDDTGLEPVLYDRLIEITGRDATAYPHVVTLESNLVEVARNVLENIRDNEDEDDDGNLTADFIEIGD